ncbi:MULTISPECIES: DUF397 domain-containing protein [Streptomyces]|nr:DUF397 domain-containing protein [Streptomyces atratus]MCT2542570.1 DUF397 domain-containing protein [Streptomyces atratus]
MTCTPIDLISTMRHRSSHSNSSGGNCLEAADIHPDLVPVRDSKRPEGPVLVIPASAWTPFVEAVKVA